MGHFNVGYRLKCKSTRLKFNGSNISPIGSADETDQMEVVVSPPPVSTYTLLRGPESPPDIHSIMYSPRSVVDSSINPCNVQIKTEQEAVNFSNNRNFRFGRKETPHLSPRLVTNGTRAPTDYPLSTKLGPNPAFTISPSEKNSSMNVPTGGGNPDGYLFGKALETSMENLMKFAEVLYKCTLCTTLPSILTSRDSFISHVNDLHLTKKQSHKECQHCNLKFSTEEDLRAHCRFSHGMETHPGDEIEPTEPSPIDEFTNKSEMEINTENQCTVGDPNKTIQSRSPRFIMESLNAKRRQAALVPSSPLIRVTNSSSPGKETVKSEKIAMEENISRLQQLADQILISNSRMSSGGAGATGTPTGFHGATSNPSYTPDFGKYTKLIREGGNIVYFCQVCNCKCQVRAAFMSHCSSYQHRGRVESADRSVASDHSPVQTQSQQPPSNQSTQPPPPAHSHPHSQRHQQNSHPPFHHQQTHQLLLPQSTFKRDHMTCSSSSSVTSGLATSVNNSNNSNSINNNNNKSNTPGNNSYSKSILNSKKNILYSGQTSSSSPTPTPTSSLTTCTSSVSTFTNTTSSSSSSVTTNTNSSLPSSSPSSISPSPAEAPRASKSPSEDRSLVASPSAVWATPPCSTRKTPASATASPTPDDHPCERSPTPGPTSDPVSDCELDKDGQRKRLRGDTSSDVDSNCDREVTTRQRRKRHAPVAVRQPQVTTSWSDSDSDEGTVCAKTPKKSIEGDSDEEDNNNNNNNNNNDNNNNNKNNNNSNNSNNDDDNTGSTSTSSSSGGSSSSSSSSSHYSNGDSSHKGSSNSNNTSSNSSNSSSNSSNSTTYKSNNTVQSCTDMRTNSKTDNEHPQPGDKAANEELDSQSKGSPDTGRKTPRSPRSSPALTRVPTPELPDHRANDTPVDFSMTEMNCSNLPQNTDSLGMLSSVVEGFLVSKNQAPLSFGSFDKSPAANTLTSIKSEPDERADSDPGGLRGIYRCSFCDYVCYDIRDYEEHYVKEHDPDFLDVTLTDTSGKTVHGEYWKMLKVKDILPELLVGCAKGYVSRDILLQKISLLLNIPEVVHWGPACNKAVREEFPNSLAQRKGKFKKTYYFGVALIEQLQEQEELSDSDNVTYQPLRDLAQDLEKILQFLPELVFWTGDLDVGISRDEVLQLLGEKIEETGVQYWGVQCNRAMRFLFPSIHMKRKGKFKTTVYFGVDFMKNITRQIPQAFDSDQTMYIKSEPFDDSYDSVEPKSLHPEMTCAIFPTSVPLVVSTSPSTTSTAVATRSYSTGIE